MGQITRAGGGRYVQPVKSDGTTTNEHGGGVYTLTAGSTYYYILGGISAPFQTVHLQGLTAGLIITSATIQDTNAQVAEVSDVNSTAGAWVSETPASGNAEFDGTGWSSSTAIVAASGAGVGGATWHLSEMAAARTRLEVVVGGTGGDARLSYHGKA